MSVIRMITTVPSRRWGLIWARQLCLWQPRRTQHAFLAQDVMWNKELFARNPQKWRPDLYQWIREHRRAVSSIPDFEDEIE
ncbi:MAG: hypothetical protein ALECFALPRED_009623 [Alectoria fallacina]|uniref:Uncharacterized protein n=1 Tax=Alectoria fallacina TaxID=1903189 RepID=A0A8H3J7T6_9LECA|nr:MAG: hypothetical protein ALECFALPRED_009623 [Alectoria fallacina]